MFLASRSWTDWLWSLHTAPVIVRTIRLSIRYQLILCTDKEQWEIIISQLFKLCPTALSEVWAIDWQSHGQSAVVNEALLKTRLASAVHLVQIGLAIDFNTL